MKRFYLFVLIVFSFVFVNPNQTFASTIAKGKEINIKIKNCELNKTKVLANKIEFSVNGESHRYKISGGDLNNDFYTFNFDSKTINDFKDINLDNILTTILSKINNGVMKGCGEEKLYEYKWNATKSKSLYQTFNIKIEIEEN